MEKYQYFNGLKFTRDEKTGYYLNSTIRKRIHRYVWEHYKGEIPKGYHVHHMDHDKSNNDINNLRLVPSSKHATMHGYERADEHYQEMIDNLDNNARPKASEWHGSKEGIEWHKKQYEKTKDRFKQEREFKCEVCGNNFKSTQTRSRFCSNKCKSAYRRNSGVDDIIIKCEQCGNDFKANKYSKVRFCSKSCSNKAEPRLPQLKLNN